jgi:hypothetical protein
MAGGKQALLKHIGRVLAAALGVVIVITALWNAIEGDFARAAWGMTVAILLYLTTEDR